MRASKPVPTPPKPNEKPDEMQCEHFADGSSLCVRKGWGILLVETPSPYLVQPCTPDSKPEEPTP